MKQLRLSLAAMVLTIAFSIPAFAGDMQTTVTSQPQTLPSAVSAGDMYGGYIQPTEQNDEAANFNPITETALNLIQSVLSLF